MYKVKKIKDFLKDYFKNTNFLFWKDRPWKRQFRYKKEKFKINIIWQVVKTTGTIVVPHDNIRAKIWTPNGLILKKIEETPHYKWINDIVQNRTNTSSELDYRHYIESYFPTEDVEKQVVKVKKMVKEFIFQNDIDKSPIVVYPPVLAKEKDYIVVLCDGVHRVALAKSLGRKTSKCYVIKERVDDIQLKEMLKEYFQAE